MGVLRADGTTYGHNVGTVPLQLFEITRFPLYEYPTPVPALLKEECVAGPDTVQTADLEKYFLHATRKPNKWE